MGISDSGKMDGASMVLGYITGNQVVIDERNGNGHNTPSIVNPLQSISPYQLFIPNYYSSLAFSFKVINSANKWNFAEPKIKTYIWAISNIKVIGGSIREHEGNLYGSFTTEFQNTLNPPTKTSSNYVDTTSNTTQLKKNPILTNISIKKVHLIHGVLMFIAWSVAPFVGVFFARYLKHLGHIWFIIHVTILVLFTVSVTIVAVTLEILYRPGPHFKTDYGHGLLGLFIVLTVIAQCILGIVIDIFYKPQRKKIPLFDKIHWWVGRILVIAGITNCFTGTIIIEADSWVRYGFIGYIIVAFAIFLILPKLLFGSFLGKKIHKNNDIKLRTIKTQGNFSINSRNDSLPIREGTFKNVYKNNIETKKMFNYENTLRSEDLPDNIIKSKAHHKPKNEQMETRDLYDQNNAFKPNFKKKNSELDPFNHYSIYSEYQEDYFDYDNMPNLPGGPVIPKRTKSKYEKK